MNTLPTDTLVNCEREINAPYRRIEPTPAARRCLGFATRPFPSALILALLFGCDAPNTRLTTDDIATWLEDHPVDLHPDTTIGASSIALAGLQCAAGQGIVGVEHDGSPTCRPLRNRVVQRHETNPEAFFIDQWPIESGERRATITDPKYGFLEPIQITTEGGSLDISLHAQVSMRSAIPSHGSHPGQAALGMSATINGIVQAGGCGSVAIHRYTSEETTNVIIPARFHCMISGLPPGTYGVGLSSRAWGDEARTGFNATGNARLFIVEEVFP